MEKLIPEAVGSLCQKGERPANEDFVLQERGIFIVADGFGGPKPGATAAKVATQSAYEFLRRESGDEDATLPFELRQYFSLAGNIVFNALIHANREVLKKNWNRSALEKGGASLVCGYMDGELLAIGNVGCCSAWLFRDGRGVELVQPKSYAKLLDPLTKFATSGTDAPLVALGLQVDFEPEISEFRMRTGDWLLFHSDGMTEEAFAKIEALQAEFSSQFSQKKATAQEKRNYIDRVINQAKEAHFRDNISILLNIF